jgi:hypothetical protein
MNGMSFTSDLQLVKAGRRTVNLTHSLDAPPLRLWLEGAEHALLGEADARTRTGDPFITSEVLYQLSYVGRPT